MRLALAAVVAFLAAGYVAGSGAVEGLRRIVEMMPL